MRIQLLPSEYWSLFADLGIDQSPASLRNDVHEAALTSSSYFYEHAVRQLSEWGMRMIQGQFPRVKDKLRFEEWGERKVILRLMVHLYNFQTDQVGMNQILNTFRKL